MTQSPDPPYVAFAGSTCFAAGDLQHVAMQAKDVIDGGGRDMIIIFDARTSHPVDVDLRGTPAQVRERLQVAGAPADGTAPNVMAALDPAGSSAEALPLPSRRTPGRPKLGVVAREVTLFPRHWEWLSRQPGGASATLRRLVEEARRSTAREVRVREARESCYRFMTALAGNEPGYEEAARALFAGDRERFHQQTAQWPGDVRDHARRLAERSL